MLYLNIMARKKFILLSPPACEDKETQRMASILFILTLAVGLLLDILYVSHLFLLPEKTTRWLSLLFFFNVFFVIILVLPQKGKVKLASQLFCYTQVAATFVTSLTGGGIRDESVASIPLVIIYTSMLLGWKRAAGVGLVFIAWCGFLYFAEARHFIPQSKVVLESLSLTIYSVLLIVLMALLQYLSMNNANKALDEAKQELEVKKEAETISLQYQKEIELLVKEHTKELATASERLAAMKAEIEDKVVYRTAELQETNDQYLATIIELQKKTDALTESENRYDVLINSIMHSVVVSTIEGDILFINQAARELFGSEKSDLSGVKTTDYWVDKTKRRAFNNEIQEKGFVNNFEAKIKTINNTQITVTLSASLIDYHGKKVILSIFNDITTQKEIEFQIITRTIETEERERNHFAQELHDGLGPLLSAAKMYLQWIAKEEGKPNVPGLINKTIGLVDEAHKTTREISHKLSPHILQNFGFVAALRNLAERTTGVKDLGIDFSNDFDSHEQTFRKLGIHVETVLYRTVSECINNTIKHAKATNISISAQEIEHQMLITYKDNGVGFDVSNIQESKKGMGLFNMKNRVEAIKGVFFLESVPGSGTTITIGINV